MRICIPVPCFLQMDFSDAIRKIGEPGFDAARPTPETPGPGQGAHIEEPA